MSMWKLKTMNAAVCLFCLCSCSNHIVVKQVFEDAESQTSVMINEVRERCPGENDSLLIPRTLDKDGNLLLVKSSDWTSGFFPGVLWYLYEYTGKDHWRSEAQIFTKPIEKEKYNAGTHDIGFKVYCSFGNGYRLTGDSHYREVIIDAASTLSKRFNPVTGCIRSWDHSRSKWENPVIIDNMMNLELLFAASRLTGDPSFYQIAVSHANTTMKNHFREDYSTYHVVDYDTITGKVLKRTTHQGYSDGSTWARGEAWALYGYTMCYRETQDVRYLRQAEHVAAFILNHPRLPEDLIPYWDFDAPGIPDEPRDASAATVMASALYELSTYSENKDLYIKKADKMLESLANNYRATNGQAHGFILLHSTGSKPSDSEVDVPLSYADYYYLEAILRSQRLKAGQPVVQK